MGLSLLCACAGGAVSGGPPGDASDSATATADTDSGAATADGAHDTAPDAGDLEGPVIDVLLPADGATLGGLVTVHVVADDPAGVESLVVSVQGATLADSNPLPEVFLGAWSTPESEDGPTKIAIRAVDAHGNERHAAVSVVVHNGSGRLVAGHVSLGWPVRGAAVSIYERGTAGALGARLAEGTTDSDGAFSLATGRDAESGWGVVVVEGPGGQVEDPGSGEALGLTKDDALLAVVPLPSGAGSTVVRVNLWTTAAARLVRGLEQWGTGFDHAPGLAAKLLAEHLQRPEPFDLNAYSPIHPDDDELIWDTPSARLGLLHVGLARLASAHDATILDAARLLAADLTDAVFDGVGSLDGQQAGPLKWPDATPVTMEDTRYHLALAIVAWADEALTGKGAVSGLTLELLDVPGGLLDTIAGDDGPLYAEPGQPFDEDPPVVQLTAPTPDEQAWVAGEALTVVAVAQDESKLASFGLTTTPGAPVQDNVVGSTLTATVALANVPDGPLELAATAVDTSRGALTGQALRVVRVDRTAPVILAASVEPPVGAWVAASSVAVGIDAQDPASGVASVVLDPVGGCPGCGQVALSLVGEKWQGVLPLKSEGEATWLLVARDVAGNQATLPYALVRDTEPPALAALPSPYAPAKDLALAAGTTPAVPVFEDPESVDLRALCCLDGAGGCAPGACAEPISLLAGGACGPMPPVLRFEVADAGAVTLHATLTSGPFVTKLDPQPLAGDEAGVALCGGALGQQLLESPAGMVHALVVTATDHAGNESEPIALSFEVAPVLPPIRVALVSDVDEWDLAGFSFDDATLHVPFGPAGEGGANGMPGYYRLARYEVVNPWDLELLLVSNIVPPLQVERSVRRSYLKTSGADHGCLTSHCKYVWLDAEPGELSEPGSCVLKYGFSDKWETLDVVAAPYVVSGGTMKALDPKTKVSMVPHSSFVIDHMIQSTETCFVPPPAAHEFGGTTSIVYPESTSSCPPALSWAGLEPYDGATAWSYCTLNTTKAGSYLSPRIVSGIRLSSVAKSVPGVYLTYTLAGTMPRTVQSGPVLDSLYTLTSEAGKCPSANAY